MKMRLSRAALALLALAFATMILAFVPSAAFAAKKATPPAKPLIMGTPAQLVSDLKNAGFDLANGRVLKPELMKKGETEDTDTRDVWSISNATLYTDKQSGELKQIRYNYYKELASAVNKEAALDPMNSLYPVLIGGKNSLYKRYGEAHRVVTNSSYTGYSYEILFRQLDPVLWRCSFGYDGEGNAWLNARVEMRHFSEVRVEKRAGTVSHEGGYYVMCNDLAVMGILPGMLCTKQEALMRGKPDPNVPNSLDFKNAHISADKRGVIRTFMLFEEKGFFSFIMRLISTAAPDGNYTWPRGTFSKTLHKGRKAVISRYGTPSEGSYNSDDLSYFVLLVDGTRLVPVKVTFSFADSFGMSFYMAIGKVLADPVYVYTQHQSPKP
jgi:hypothetical protein